MAILARLTLRYKDYTSENSNFAVRGTPWTALNQDAQVALQDALIAATNALAIGALQETSRLAYTTEISAAPAVDPFAQRETKWLIVYEDTTSHKLYRAEIPCADLDLVDAQGELALGAERTAFISAFQAYVLSETGGNVEIRSIRHVGRNI